MVIEVYIDGLTEPVNPGGVATYGVVIKNTAINGINELRGVVGKGPGMSNNVAEYAALYHALLHLIRLGIGNGVDPYVITIKSDSQLVIKQMSGEWACHGGLYIGMMNEARKLLKEFRRPLYYQWIPREQNEKADALSREAYEDYCKSHGLEVLYMQSKNIKDPKFRNTDDLIFDVEENLGSSMNKATREIITKSFEETRAMLESMRKQQPKEDIVIQDETPNLTGEGSKTVKDQIPNYPYEIKIDNVYASPAMVKYYETPSKQVMQEIKAIETCKQCHWIRYSGPHVGCYPNGKYRKWLSKIFVQNNKCELFKPSS